MSFRPDKKRGVEAGINRAGGHRMFQWIVMTAAGTLVDLGIRHVVSHNLENGEEKSLADGKVVVTKFENSGAMCGFLKDDPRKLRVLSLTAMGMAAGWFLAKLAGRRPLPEQLGASMMAAGAAANVSERLARGKVTDYLRFPFLPGKAGKLVYNIGDFLIFAGTFLSIVCDLAAAAGRWAGDRLKAEE